MSALRWAIYAVGIVAFAIGFNMIRSWSSPISFAAGVIFGLAWTTACLRFRRTR